MTALLIVILALAHGSALATVSDAREMADRVAACSACHGDQGRAGPDAYYPRIAGKPEGYLYNQLINFREGRRRYHLMTLLVENLPDAYLLEIARYFAGRNPPYPPPAPVAASETSLKRGQALVVDGDPTRDIPACTRCHGDQLMGAMPAIPGLLGLPRDYLSAQLGAWKAHARRSAEPDCMAEVARRLDASDVAALAAWLASRPVPERPGPAARLDPLPMACGAVPQRTEDKPR